MFSTSTMFSKKFFAHENMKKTASKVAKPAQIQPKSQFLFHKNLPPCDFSIMFWLKWYLFLSCQHDKQIIDPSYFIRALDLFGSL